MSDTPYTIDAEKTSLFALSSPERTMSMSSNSSTWSSSTTLSADTCAGSGAAKKNVNVYTTCGRHSNEWLFSGALPLPDAVCFSLRPPHLDNDPCFPDTSTLHASRFTPPRLHASRLHAFTPPRLHTFTPSRLPTPRLPSVSAHSPRPRSHKHKSSKPMARSKKPAEAAAVSSSADVPATPASASSSAVNPAAIPGNGPVPKGQAKTLYLTAYNFVSAVLWATVLGRVVFVGLLRGPAVVPLAVNVFLRRTQTLALLEVVHSALGVVRAPLFTTVMQVASRLLLVWAVVFPFPAATTTSAFYSSMLLAWSATEVIRYAYFSLSLASGPDHPPPAAFTRLRYSTFLVLYPVGIASEVRLVYLAAVTPGAADALSARLFPAYAGASPSVLSAALYAVLAIYVPGSYILYTHMLKQRRKVLRRLKADAGKAQ